MSNQVLRMKYHPAKKEIVFKLLQCDKEIEIRDDSSLQNYMRQKGKFVLQDQGNEFFNTIVKKVFNGESSVQIEVTTTKADFGDLLQMIDFYNESSDDKITATLLAELPDMDETFSVVRKHGTKAIDAIAKSKADLYVQSDAENVKKYISSLTGKMEKEIENINGKVESLRDNSVNLCFTGVYSAGKSALINAILGYRILPEAIDSKTARMFKIMSPEKNTSVRIVFSIFDGVSDSHTELLWNDESKSFAFSAGPTENDTRKKIQDAVNANNSLAQHDQILKILNVLNAESSVSTEIQVFFPIPLDSESVQFTIFDTPGTDSDEDAHKKTLQDALSVQTHSILVFVAAPDKIEGEGNNALLSYLKDAEQNSSNTTIDIGRSLFVINKAETVESEDRVILQNKAIKLKSDSNFSIQLSNKKLFFVTAKSAYSAKAIANGVATPSDEKIYKKSFPIIRDEEDGFFYRQDRVATSELSTQQLISSCDEALSKAQAKDDNLEVMHICSGLYALETEIVNYGKKFASAVRAFSIIDSVDGALSSVSNEAKVLAQQNQKDIDAVNQEIEELRCSIEQSIADAETKYNYPENEPLPHYVLKKLQLDSESLHELINQKVLRPTGERLRGGFFGLGKVRFSEKDKEYINNRVEETLCDYTETFKFNRKKFLKIVGNDFVDDVKRAIQENGELSEEAKQYFKSITPPEPPKTAGCDISNLYDANKLADKFLWMDTPHLDKDSFMEDLDKGLTKMGTKIHDNYEHDFREILIDTLNEVKEDFLKRLADYSSLLHAKVEDKQAMEILSEKIQKTAAGLKACQDELNEKIWSENGNG